LNAKDKRSLETQLVAMGLAGLQANGDPSPELVQQMAAVVNSWKDCPNRLGEWIGKHEFLRDLLNECDRDKRSDMYEAIRPFLKFKVKAFNHYELMISEKAGNFVSKRKMRVTGEREKPIQVGDHKILITTPENGTLGWAMLRCHQCERIEKFLGKTPVDAMYKARAAGWRRNVALEQESCPECAKPLIVQQEGKA
jgi:hypothetical protein